MCGRWVIGRWFGSHVFGEKRQRAAAVQNLADFAHLGTRLCESLRGSETRGPVQASPSLNSHSHRPGKPLQNQYNPGMNTRAPLAAMKRIKLFCLGWGLGLHLLLHSAAPGGAPTELLRQGVVAEETGKGPDEAAGLYRRAAEAGEVQRVATATALYRLGEMEWRAGKTNEAVGTWRLLAAQYADQTNLLSLIRERLPSPTSPIQRPQRESAGSTSNVGRPGVEATPLTIAAASVGQLDQLPQNQWSVWLQLQGVKPPGLALLEQQRDQVTQAYTTARTDLGPDHPKMREYQRSLEILAKQIAQETADVVGVLRHIATPQPTEGIPGAAVSPKAAPADADADLSAEERTELERVRKILRDSPDVLSMRTRQENRSPFEDAAERGFTKVLTFLATNGIRPQGTWALSLAAQSGQLAAVQELLRLGADPNEAVDYPTPLACAAAKGHRRVLEALLKAGATVNALGPYRNHTFNYNIDGPPGGTGSRTLTAVHAAVFNQSRVGLEVLAAAGADLNLPDAAGRSPLAIAVREGTPEQVTFLLARGVDVNRPDRAGITPLLATGNRRIQLELLAAGADPNQRFLNGESPLWGAVGKHDPELVKLLLEKGARTDVWVQENSVLGQALGSESYMKAPNDVRRDLRTIVEMLLKAGAKTSPIEVRLLLMCVFTEDPELVALALKRGEAPSVPNEETPPLLAAVRTSAAITALLLEAGADPNQPGTVNFMPDRNTGRPPSAETAFELAYRQLLASAEPEGGVIQLGSQDPRVFSRRFFFLSPEDRRQIYDLLVAKGGRRMICTPGSVGFATAITNRIYPFFQQTPISVEREFTLAEMLDRILLRSLEPGREEQSPMPWYPDLAGAYIYNDLVRTEPPKQTPVNLAALIETGDFGKSLRLNWGDLLIVPKQPRKGDTEPYVLPAEKSKALGLAIRKIIRLGVGSEPVKAFTFELGAIVEPTSPKPYGSANIYQMIRTLAQWQSEHFQQKFHGRFRVVRPGEPGALDRVFRFDATLGAPGFPMAGVRNVLPPSPPPAGPVPGVPGVPVAVGRLVAPPSPRPAGSVSSAAGGEEFPDGDGFVLQDGDQVTLYPLPKP